MRLYALRRWQWCLIGLVAGALFGSLRALMFGDVDSQFKVESLSQGDFLRGIGTSVQSITVMPVKGGRYGAKVMYVVPARWGGRGARPQAKPEAKPHWYEPTANQLHKALAVLIVKNAIVAVGVRVAEHRGIHIDRVPEVAREQSTRPREFLRKFCEVLHIKPPDPPLVEYLRRLTDSRGQHVTFTFAWWIHPRVEIIGWTLLSFVAIGGIWPTIVNLIAFHSLFRPKEKKTSLRNVKSTAASMPMKSGAAVTDKDMDHLRALERELEAKLKASEANAGPMPAPAPVVEAPVRQLTAKESEVAQIQKTEEEKLFDRKSGDFYPVERHVKKDTE